MRGTLSKRHIGHKSHIHGKSYMSRNKKAVAFYEADEKRLRRKYVIKDNKNDGRTNKV